MGFNLDDDAFNGDEFGSGFGNDSFDDSFGDDLSNDDFGDSFNSSDNKSGFGDSFNSSDNGADFSGAFDTNTNTATNNDNKESIRKNSLVMILVAVVIIIITIIIGSKFINKGKDTNKNIESNVKVSNESSNRDANEIMKDNVPSNTKVINSKKESDFVWSEITDNEDVLFNDDYKELVFTITKLEHRARAVDTNNNLVVKTTLQGSISGLSGTYELDIPYNKGVKLVVGDSFTVYVQLGTYNNKTVVGEIKY